jgi:hypothetical protein
MIHTHPHKAPEAVDPVRQDVLSEVGGARTHPGQREVGPHVLHNGTSTARVRERKKRRTGDRRGRGNALEHPPSSTLQPQRHLISSSLAFSHPLLSSLVLPLP